jgi:signal peptidase
MKKVFKILHVVLYSLIIGVGLLLLITLFPIEGNFQIKIVSSGSMEPAVKVGSIVIIKPVSQYKVGDVVTFGGKNEDEIPTTHRIISERISDGEVLYSTKGDANEDKDPSEIREKDVIGKVLFSVPFVGYFINFARKPLGIVLIILIPALFIVYDEVIKIVSEIKILKSRDKDKISNNEEDSKKE